MIYDAIIIFAFSFAFAALFSGAYNQKIYLVVIVKTVSGLFRQKY